MTLALSIVNTTPANRWNVSIVGVSMLVQDEVYLFCRFAYFYGSLREFGANVVQSNTNTVAVEISD